MIFTTVASLGISTRVSLCIVVQDKGEAIEGEASH